MTHYARKLYWSKFKDEAINLHLTAIEKGNCEAAYNLAYSYMYKNRDFENALKYFELAFEQEYPPAREALISLHKERHLRNEKYVTEYFSNDSAAVTEIYH
jgi:TPR repeat protein